MTAEQQREAKIGRLVFKGSEYSEPKFCPGDEQRDGRAASQAIDLLAGKLLVEFEGPGNVRRSEIDDILKAAMREQLQETTGMEAIPKDVLLHRALATVLAAMNEPAHYQDYVGKVTSLAGNRLRR